MTASAVLRGMLPEHLLLGGIVLLTCMAIAGIRRGATAVSVVTTVSAAVAAILLAATGYFATPFAGQFSVSPATFEAKAIVLALAAAVPAMAREEFPDGPFHILTLSSLYGVCVLVSSDSFLTLFLGLELMSLPVYALVLVAWRRPESAEAALKYLVLGGAATATLLMGASLLFGWSATLDVGMFAAALAAQESVATVGVVLVIIAFFVKAAIVPFHTWAPDAYEAASVPVTAYMSTIVKAGALFAIVRLFGVAPIPRPIVGLLALLPLLSIVWGNLAAMRQPSLRRMIAYSSIAHAGYLFYALLGDGPGRFQAVAFYVLAYGVMNVLAFAALPAADDDRARDRLDGLKGLFSRRPFAAVMIAIAMLSLAGVPPFPGFVAKFLIFRNVMAAGYTLYAVLGLVGSYLGLYFYLRVIQYMFMSPSEPGAAPAGTGRIAFSTGVACLVAAVAIGVFPGWFVSRL
jgi:NADH-quinone oxidoreductase subunit N